MHRTLKKSSLFDTQHSPDGYRDHIFSQSHHANKDYPYSV